MADNTVMQTLYSKEWIKAHEQKESYLRGCVSVEGEVKGDNFVFIIEGVADEAKERAANGNIPYATDDQTSLTCTLKEYHHLARKNNFRIFSSSVPQRMSMQSRGVVSINYKTDQLVLDQLETATLTSGAAAANSLAKMLEATATLDENHVPDDGERYGLLTPMAWAQAMRVNQFASGDWVPDKPFMKYVQWRQWMGVKWTKHPNLPGVTTNSASCFVFHKASVGHAMNMDEMQTKIGQNEEHDYSWARVTSYQGSKALQLSGIFELVHDDTAALT
jgi:hypothetical protein